MAIPRHSAAIGDVLPRYQVVSVLYSTGQIVGDILNGGQRNGFTQDIYAVRHHDFRIVKQRVKALIGRVFCGNGFHQLRVYHSEDGVSSW